MSSVYFDGPRHSAGGRKQPEEASSNKLWLIGKNRSEQIEEHAGGAAERLLSGPTLLLYVATAVIVVATGFWVISDVNRQHRPVDISRESAPTIPPLKTSELAGPALTPPAKLGDGVADTSPDALRLPMQDAPSREMSSTPAPAPAATATANSFAAVAPAEAPEAQPALTEGAIAQPTTVESAPATELAPVSRAEVKAPPAATASCLVKVGGKVLFQRSCAVERQGSSRAALSVGEQKLIVSLVRGETWQATLGAKSLGNVYKTGECWGRRKEVYICAAGRRS